MKAIQIKYLAPTNTQGTRLKAWTEAGAIIEPRDYALDDREQAKQLAQRYTMEKGWCTKIAGFGTLPNGDYVATLGE